MVDLVLLVVRAAIVADKGECEETELPGTAPVFKDVSHFQNFKQYYEYLNHGNACCCMILRENYFYFMLCDKIKCNLFLKIKLCIKKVTTGIWTVSH